MSVVEWSPYHKTASLERQIETMRMIALDRERTIQDQAQRISELMVELGDQGRIIRGLRNTLTNIDELAARALDQHQQQEAKHVG